MQKILDCMTLQEESAKELDLRFFFQYLELETLHFHLVFHFSYFTMLKWIFQVYTHQDLVLYYLLRQIFSQ